MSKTEKINKSKMVREYLAANEGAAANDDPPKYIYSPMLSFLEKLHYPKSLKLPALYHPIF